jgi:hypothetical protein
MSLPKFYYKLSIKRCNIAGNNKHFNINFGFQIVAQYAGAFMLRVFSLADDLWVIKHGGCVLLKSCKQIEFSHYFALKWTLILGALHPMLLLTQKGLI